MSKKKSFFERLTGGISLADDNESTIVTANDEEKNQTEDETNNWIKEEAEVGELAVDVYQTGSEIVIKTMVAGVKVDEIDIITTRETVTIKGKREAVHEARDEDYFLRELYWGAFARTVVLPAEVEADEVDATEKNGLLTIRLAKIDKKKSQKIKVKSL